MNFTTLNKVVMNEELCTGEREHLKHFPCRRGQRRAVTCHAGLQHLTSQQDVLPKQPSSHPTITAPGCSAPRPARHRQLRPSAAGTRLRAAVCNVGSVTPAYSRVRREPSPVSCFPLHAWEPYKMSPQKISVTQRWCVLISLLAGQSQV